MAISQKFCRDNQISNRLIEHGTKALERELMSGETLRAPRQQLRPLRSVAFVFYSNCPLITARAHGAFFSFQ